MAFCAAFCSLKQLKLMFPLTLQSLIFPSFFFSLQHTMKPLLTTSCGINVQVVFPYIAAVPMMRLEFNGKKVSVLILKKKKKKKTESTLVKSNY